MPALDFDALHRSLRKGDFAPAYYFHGDQDVLKDDALRDLLEVGVDPATRDFNLDRRRAGDLTAEEFESLAMTPPMMAARRALVIADAEQLQQKRRRTQDLRTAVLTYLERPSSETLLVLVAAAGEKPDADLIKRTAAVDFRTLPPDRLLRWIHHRAGKIGLQIDDAAARHLYAVVGDDLAQIAAELGKLKAAAGERPATREDVEELVGIRHGETVHEFVNEVTGRDFAKAAGMVQHLLTSPGQSGVTLVIALGSALAGLGVARGMLDGGERPAEVANQLIRVFKTRRPFGVGDWKERAKRWSADAGRWSAAELDVAAEVLLKADGRLKNTRVISEADVVVEALLTLGAAAVPA